MLHTVRRLACAGLIALSLGLAPRLAAAHANPTRAEPGIETVTPTPPTELKVWFSEELAPQGNSLEVLDSSGARVDRGDARVDLNDPDRKLLVVSLNPLPDGVYTVTWRSVSRADGHEASGSFRFGVGANTVLPPRRAEGAPRIAIDTASLAGRDLQVRLTVQGVTIRRPPQGGSHGAEAGHSDHSHDGAPSGGPYGHLHVYLDGVDVLHAYEPAFTLSQLPAGSHQLRIVLMTEQHQDWDPPVETTLTVLVP